MATQSNENHRVEILLISENTLKSESYINDNVPSEMILPSIVSAQDMHLQPILGCNLYNKLKDLVRAAMFDDEEVPEPYKELLDTYIRPFLCFAVTADLQIPLAFKNRAAGAGVQSNNEYSYNSTREEVTMLKNYYTDKMNFYQFRIQDYLKNNRTQFPELNGDCGCGSDLKQPGFECGLFLD